MSTAVWLSTEVVNIRGRRRDRRVARDHHAHDAAQRLDAERQRRHVEQQHVAAAAREDVRLHGGAERDDLVRDSAGCAASGRTAPAPGGARAGCASSRRPARPRRSPAGSRPASASACRHGPSVDSTSGADQRLEIRTRDLPTVRERLERDGERRALVERQPALGGLGGQAELLHGLGVGRESPRRARPARPRAAIRPSPDRSRRRRGACRRWWRAPRRCRLGRAGSRCRRCRRPGRRPRWSPADSRPRP